MKYDIFISYRRNDGEYTAKIIKDRLQALGYRVFFDVETLRSGNFNAKLLDVIDECKDFILILSPNSLERCEDNDDWVRKEITHALNTNKNIVPIPLRGFNFPASLPEEIEAIRNINWIAVNTEFFDAFIIKLTTFLHSKPSISAKLNSSTILKYAPTLVLVFVIAMLALWRVADNKESYVLKEPPASSPDVSLSPSTALTQDANQATGSPQEPQPTNQATGSPQEPQPTNQAAGSPQEPQPTNNTEQIHSSDKGPGASPKENLNHLNTQAIDNQSATPQPTNKNSDEAKEANKEFLIGPNGGLELYYGTNTNIVVPDGVRGLDYKAFSNSYISSDITHVTLPSGLETIGESSFSDCTSLQSIKITDGLLKIYGDAFSGCISLTSITIPNSADTIGERAFLNCIKLESIGLPKGIKSIAKSTFSGCESLQSINIPDSVTNIYEAAFLGCSGMTEINLPNGVLDIGNEAFSGCSKLTKIIIPPSVQKIGRNAFYGCQDLVIYGNSPSYAEKYATENNIKFVAR